MSLRHFYRGWPGPSRLTPLVTPLPRSEPRKKLPREKPSLHRCPSQPGNSAQHPQEGKKSLAEALTFSSQPLIQGIILSEVLGPPKSELPGRGILGDMPG